MGHTVKILLVDDHELVRKGLKALLESFDHFVVYREASNGQEAIDIANYFRPDVIVMDISMPVMKGIEAAGIIHRTAPEIPILVLSMHSSQAYAKAARDAGALGYVPKDAPYTPLLEGVSTVLHHRECFREN